LYLFFPSSFQLVGLVGWLGWLVGWLAGYLLMAGRREMELAVETRGPPAPAVNIVL
jgi:hypothetical protein